MNESASDRVRLGTSEIEISSLGVGTWAWGDRFVWGYGQGSYDDADLRAAFTESLAAGINWFDTAEVYGLGRSEQLLGRFLKSAHQPVLVATKFMPFPWRLRRQSLVSALRKSLDRLGLRQIDLYQIHKPLPPVLIETWMAGMADAVEAGLLNAVGVSSYNLAQTHRAHRALAERGLQLASNQIEYSLLARKPELTGLLDTCRELGVTVIAYSPLAQGILTGKYTPDNPPHGLRNWSYSGKLLIKVQPLINLMREIGQSHNGKTPAQIALNWTICKGTVPIPGAKNARQAGDNAGALGWRLTADEVKQLDQVSLNVSS
jgi:aryl-alcohol dehydrogenase-like predicted oxidoreductase